MTKEALEQELSKIDQELVDLTNQLLSQSPQGAGDLAEIAITK